MSDRESSGDPATQGRRLMRRCERAALATNFGGTPYVSLVLVAIDLDGRPLLLLSDLAQHSRNVAFDPRVSLLLDGTAGHADRLDGPRLTLLGRAETVADPRLLARFTARHPSSVLYAGFADFRIYRLAVERGHLVAGFGRIDWIDGAPLLYAGDITALAEAEPTIVAQMNRDDAAAVEMCARRILGRIETGWRITGIDPEGIDISCTGGSDRLDFPVAVHTAAAARAALAGIVEKARG